MFYLVLQNRAHRSLSLIFCKNIEKASGVVSSLHDAVEPTIDVIKPTIEEVGRKVQEALNTLQKIQKTQ